ncbi:MAG: nucleotidyltransferase domain-containing protein [Pseudomonadota bacterium]
MRLSDFQRAVIRDAIRRYFGDDAKVYLFGSRVDDTLRGGDIDLYVECPTDTGDLLDRSLGANAAIQKQLGEQKIDIVVWVPGRKLLPIHEAARAQGVAI